VEKPFASALIRTGKRPESEPLRRAFLFREGQAQGCSGQAPGISGAARGPAWDSGGPDGPARDSGLCPAASYLYKGMDKGPVHFISTFPGKGEAGTGQTPGGAGQSSA